MCRPCLISVWEIIGYIEQLVLVATMLTNLVAQICGLGFGAQIRDFALRIREDFKMNS